jgi:hypothetical protein
MIKLLLLLMTLLICKFGFTQDISELENKESMDKLSKRHAIVIEGLGKTWGATLSYEYRIHENFSSGVGFGTSPAFHGGELVGVGYGIFHFGKERNNFVASTGVMFSNVLISPNLGLGYEYESNLIYFRVMPYAIIGLDNDYPILPSLGLYLGIKI